MKITITSNSPGETESIGMKLGSFLTKKCVIAFFGDLGSGKTRFAAGLCRGIGYKGDVTSPTFAIINEYIGGRLPIYHFDVYRISSSDELDTIGFYDYIESDGIVLIEWSENIADSIPNDAVLINISGSGEEKRTIKISCDIRNSLSESIYNLFNGGNN